MRHDHYINIARDRQDGIESNGLRLAKLMADLLNDVYYPQEVLADAMDRLKEGGFVTK
jgi:hypothetical protein